MFAFGEQVRTIGIMGLLPLTVLTEINMSATWKGLCRGGGAKQATYPCHCCGINSKDLARQNSRNCHRWCSAHDDPDFKCYHHEMVTDEVLEAMQGEVEELAVSLEAAAEAIKTSTLTKDDPHSIKGQENAINDPNSIWFRPNNTTERTQHSRLINRELRLRNLSTAGNATIRKSVLKESLEKEHKLARLLSDIKNCKRSESALFLLMNTIPCVLHMENRVGLKLLTMTLIEGITGASAAPTFNEDIVSTEKVRVQRYIKKVEDVVNTQILGTNENPSTWKVPYDEKKMELAPLSLENVKTRIIIDKLELLIEVSVSTADRQAKWNGSVRKYRIGMRIARQRDDFTDEDIAAFQKTIDEFFQDWVELHGMTGVTNYIHMLAAGHISTYMVEWRNLYKHLQQGWESFNSLLKSFFFRRTSRGGGRGLRSKLVPIGRWLQRRLLFLCGLRESDLEEDREPEFGSNLDEMEEELELEDDNDDDIAEFFAQLDAANTL